MVAGPGLQGKKGEVLPAVIDIATAGNVLELRPHCPACSVRALCLPHGLDERALHKLDDIIHLRTRVRRKETLYRPGERFAAVYAIRVGTFKTTVLAEDGREQ